MRIPARHVATYNADVYGLTSVDSAVSVVEIRCFSGFELVVGGQPLDLSSIRPRVRATMRYLALYANRPVHRDALLADLWPGTSSGVATHTLHVTLSSLRGFLNQLPGIERRLLHRDGDAYVLTLGPHDRVDVVAFRSTLAAARKTRLRGDQKGWIALLQSAMDIYAGDLLPEDGLAEWVVGPREELRQQVAQSMVDLALAKLARGDTVSAVEFARHCLNIDRYRDDGWRALIMAHERQGDPAAAANARRGYAAVLRSLGLDSRGAYQFR